MTALLLKLKGYLFAAGTIFLFFIGYKHEKKKRKQAEKDLDTAKANVDLLEKKEKVITDLDIRREKDGQKAAEMSTKQKVQLERLKHEDDNSVVVDNLIGMLNKSNQGNKKP